MGEFFFFVQNCKSVKQMENLCSERNNQQSKEQPTEIGEIFSSYYIWQGINIQNKRETKNSIAKKLNK
jgi:hypothetical protein